MSAGVERARPQVHVARAAHRRADVAVEVDRRHGEDQPRDLLREQRRVAGREDAALADAHQVDLLDALALAHDVDAVVEVARDVVVDRQPALRPRRVAPVEVVDVDAFGEQLAHERAIGLEVDHLVATDQRVDDQHRDALALGDGRPAAVQAHHVLAVDLVGGRRRDRQVVLGELAEPLRALGELLAQARELLQHRVGRDRERQRGGGLAARSRRGRVRPPPAAAAGAARALVLRDLVRGRAHAARSLRAASFFCAAAGRARFKRRSSRLSSWISRNASLMSSRVGTCNAVLAMPTTFCTC